MERKELNKIKKQVAKDRKKAPEGTYSETSIQRMNGPIGREISEAELTALRTQQATRK